MRATAQTTCGQIESFLPDTLQETAKIAKTHTALKEYCNDCMYSRADDEKMGAPRLALSKKLNGVVEYVSHFENLLVKRSPLDAARSAIKHRSMAIKLIDQAKVANKQFFASMTTYLKSPTFAQRVTAPNSLVSIHPREVIGSKKERRDFLAALDAKVVAELEREKRLTKSFVDKSDGNGIGHTTEEDDGEDDGIDDDGADKPDEKFELDDDDETTTSSDDESEHKPATQRDGDDTEKGEESGEISQGAVLFEQNLEINNAKVVEEVASKALVKNGRQLRQRKYDRFDLAKFGNLLSKAAIDDDDDNAGQRGKKRKTDDDVESSAGENDDSAMTESEDAIADTIELHAAEVEETRKKNAVVKPPKKPAAKLRPVPVELLEKQKAAAAARTAFTSIYD